MPTDALGRRSRFTRTRTGKRIVLTDRDTEILRQLYRYRYLRQPQLVAFLQPHSKKRFVERLGNLFHEAGLINRPARQWDRFDARCTPLIYEISKTGIEHLRGRGELPPRATTLSRRSGHCTQFPHAMMIVDALASVELETLAEPDQRFVSVDEILARAPEHTQQAANPLRVPVTIKPSRDFPDIRSRFDTHIIPDGLYGIEYLIDGEKRYRFWALECERTSPSGRRTSRRSSTALKYAAYDALIRSGAFKHHWGIPNLKLKVVT